YVEDNTAPTLTTVFRQTPSSSPTNADSLVFRVTFSEDVTGLDAADFVVGGTTGTVTSISAVGGSANVYDVTVSGGDLNNLNATVSLALKASAPTATIQDTADNAMTTFPARRTTELYVEDNTAPTLTVHIVAISLRDATNSSNV